MSEASLQDRFKSARKALGKTQKQVSKIFGVSQPQICDYELSGKGLQESHVVELESRANRRIEELRQLDQLSGARANVDEGTATRLCSDERLAQYIREFVGEWETWNAEKGADAQDPCDIYLFGSDDDNLPVFEDSGIQELWTENLQRGVNYHLFWLLDGCSKEDLIAAYTTLTRVVVRAGSDAGSKESLSSVQVHGILLNGKIDGNDRAIKTEYQTLSAVNQPRLKLGPLHDLTESRSEEDGRWHRILGLGGAVPTVLCHVSIDLGKRPAASLVVAPPEGFAARREEDVSWTPRAPRATGWPFLSQSARKKILTDVEPLSDRPTV